MDSWERHIKGLQAQIGEQHVAAQRIIDGAKSAGRKLSDSEATAVNDHRQRATSLASDLERAVEKQREEKAVLAQLKQLSDDIGGAPDPAGGSWSHGRKAGPGAAWGEAVVKAHTRDAPFGMKALLPSGAVVVAVPAPEPVSQGRPVQMLRSLIPSEPSDGRFSFLRQTVRTNNAATVAAGSRKPTSVYTMELIEDRARVIAHLTQPISRQDLADAPRLQDFVEAELYYGLEAALEDQVLNGDGTGEDFTGLNSTSGVLTVAYTTNLITTTRKAVTALENRGLAGTGWVFNPADWESIELAATSTGSLLMTEAGQRSPVETAGRRLWGSPVVTSVACPAGVGWYADFEGSTKLFVREEAAITWSEALYDANRFGTGDGGTLFEANQVVFRAEGRFGFGVLRPTGIVKVDLTA